MKEKLQRVRIIGIHRKEYTCVREESEMMKKRVGVLTGILGFVGGAISIGRLISKSSNRWKNMSDKNLYNAQLLNQWLMAKQAGIKMEDWFKRNHYKRIVIYGMSLLGERLVDELKETDIKVIAGVDKNAKGIFAEMPVLLPEEAIPDADCMVVTPVFFFDEIKRSMSSKVSYPIISLEDILYDV